jgi:hypothetical protein
MNKEFKDTFELVREREQALRKEGAENFWQKVQTRLAQIHPDTDLTVRMFTSILESEAEHWISNSGHSAKRTAE